MLATATDAQTRHILLELIFIIVRRFLVSAPPVKKPDLERPSTTGGFKPFSDKFLLNLPH